MGFLDRFRKNDNAKPSTQPLPNLEKQKPPFEVNIQYFLMETWK